MGNFALGVHLFLAAVITVGGALQLIPQLSIRVPFFHRWSWRIYMLMAFTTSIVALYLVWIRGGSAGDVCQRVGISLNAVLSLAEAYMDDGNKAQAIANYQNPSS